MKPRRPDPEHTSSRRDPNGSETGWESALVEVDCAWCGLVTLEIGELGCLASDAEERGLCQFMCPLCNRLTMKSVRLLEIKTLIVAGAQVLATAPLELLEPKTGDPLSWDDVLDFTLALNS